MELTERRSRLRGSSLQLYCKRWHGLRRRPVHFALVVSIDILARKTPQRATHFGASTYVKRATGFEPATLSLGTCPATAHEPQRALFGVFSGRGRSPALVGVALRSALPPAGARRLPLPTRLVGSIFMGSPPCLPAKPEILPRLPRGLD